MTMKQTRESCRRDFPVDTVVVPINRLVGPKRLPGRQKKNAPHASRLAMLGRQRLRATVVIAPLHLSANEILDMSSWYKAYHAVHEIRMEY